MWISVDHPPSADSRILMKRDSSYRSFPASLVTGSYRPEYQDPWRDEGNDAVTDSGKRPTHWMHIETALDVLSSVV